MTEIRAGRSGVRCPAGTGFLSSPDGQTFNEAPSTQPLTQWVPELFPGEYSGRSLNIPLRVGPTVKNEWRYTSAPFICTLDVVLRVIRTGFAMLTH